jgi:hypothetical protein
MYIYYSVFKETATRQQHLVAGMSSCRMVYQLSEATKRRRYSKPRSLGGIPDWVTAGTEYTQHLDEYVPEAWTSVDTTDYREH